MASPNEDTNDAAWLSTSWQSLIASYKIEGKGAPRVRRLEVTIGHISAQLSASKTKSYLLELELPTLNDTTWEQIIELLSDQALFAAQMLAGNLPPDIQSVFAEANCTFLPPSLDAWSQAGAITVEEKDKKKKGEDKADSITERAATDEERRQSLGAVYTMLGELFEEDPWMLLALHGRTRPQILQALRESRVNAEATPPAINGHEGSNGSQHENEYVSAFYMPRVEAENEKPRSTTEQGLEDEIDSFWGVPKRLKNIHHRIESPDIDLVLLRRLGPPPFNQDSIQIYDQFMALYRDVGNKAIAMAYAAETTAAETTAAEVEE